MKQDFRIDAGLVDRSRPLEFTFNRHRMCGFQGDTLASALIANGQKLVARSFKYHRPRGIFTAGSEEPSALVHLRSGDRCEPNTRVTTAELFEGLEATSQHHRGSLKFDLLAANDLISPFLGAGFYYKTFMWPGIFWERIYEPFIRSAAGLGQLSGKPDPDTYDKGFLHCDVLIIGGGPAGITAALCAGRAGARVILADEDFRFGGRLNSEQREIDTMEGPDWAMAAIDELSAMDEVRIMPRTTVFGAYDHGIYGALERKTDHLPDPKGKPRHVQWRIYSRQAILCAGATERSISFADNDRPGIMLSGAVQTYLNRYGALCGRQPVILTNNDSGWLTASDFLSRGMKVKALVDTRQEDELPSLDIGCRIIPGGRITGTSGRKALRSIAVNGRERIDTDCLAVSGGWNPNLHLTCHKGSRPIWDNRIAAFIPAPRLPTGMSVAGAAAGKFGLGSILTDAWQKTSRAIESLDLPSPGELTHAASDEPAGIVPFWHVASGKRRAWIDLQNDVTTKDISQSFSEGFHAVEHLKRYTTLGMATDQGKNSNVNALAVISMLTGKSIEETGTTTYRPPYTPVAIGALAGRSRGKDFRPYRLTPSHEWAKARGAVFIETGAWLRAQWYPRPHETHWRQSVDREVLATRNSVGFCDVTTLGKIDIQGEDATEFLNRIYANGFKTLAIGRVRYGLMLREDGIVYDDGTTARIGEHHYVMTTTTANAGLVFQRMEFTRQCLWPDLDVHMISVTDGWAQFSVAGPNSRQLLRKILSKDLDISNEAFPFMACAETTTRCGVKARLFRISFSGELAYEVAVPARYGNSLMEEIDRQGQEFDAVPYGTEALGVMRIEKGHFAGNELTGQTTALNLGIGRMISRKKDSIGSKLSEREAMNRKDAIRLCGFIPVDRSRSLNAGAHFFSPGNPLDHDHDEGWMTSVAYSPTLGHSIGLGFIKRGHERIGDHVIAADPLRNKTTEVEIKSPHFYDPEGTRQRA